MIQNHESEAFTCNQPSRRLYWTKSVWNITADPVVSTVLCLRFGDLLWRQIAIERRYWKRWRSLHVFQRSADWVEDYADKFRVLFSVVIGTSSITMIAPSIGEFAKAAAAAKSMLEMIARQPNIDPLGDVGEQPKTVDGHISLRNVSFAYPARPTLKVLDIGDGQDGIDFPAGKITAIVGASGSGKSTVVGLIERWYDPQEGQILLDGVDIKKLNVKWLRSQIGFVQQVSYRPGIPNIDLV
jgi:ABC-type multidrug transport system fused ATPase/permease subunit